MTVFVDTSALVAYLNADDPGHPRVFESLTSLLEGRRRLRTHSYVIAETAALVQSRHGMDAARSLHRDVVPTLSVRFVDEHLHDRAVTALLAADRRRVSLVDWTSFELMREEGIADALALDDDFAAQGFALIP